MDKLINTTESLEAARADHEREYAFEIAEIKDIESKLTERLDELNQKKDDVAKSNGNTDAKGDDLIEINAGGKIIAAKRSTLTQLKGTRMEALFSGRWDQKLQQDRSGRVFLDVNPICFQAIVDYLNELAISSEGNPPRPPSVDDDELKHILQHHLELFGLLDHLVANLPDSTIIENVSQSTLLHDWLEEDDSNGEFNLLYRSSRDGRSDSTFHSKCDNKGSTLTIVETTNGLILGGYSNTSWLSPSNARYVEANKAFLFNLSSTPQKMKLKDTNANSAVYNSRSYGPAFGSGHDLLVQGGNVYPRFGHTYEASSSPELTYGSTYTIKEMEVFQVTGAAGRIAKVSKQKTKMPQLIMPTTRFSEDINKAIDAKRTCLMQAEVEMNHLENSFKDEQAFIEEFVCGDAKDVVVLNVSGTIMMTRRSTLCIAEDSVLAQQFDDSKWTQQNTSCRVKEWTPEEVGAWAKKIDDISDEVAQIFVENEITGNELLALSMEGLKMIGIERAGTLCLLLEEIKTLKQASQDVATLIEHGPYCFGKILDYLRLKSLYSQGLVKETPGLPKVCNEQRGRFDKVVKYYFPGDSAKFILG